MISLSRKMIVANSASFIFACYNQFQQLVPPLSTSVEIKRLLEKEYKFCCSEMNHTVYRRTL